MARFAPMPASSARGNVARSFLLCAQNGREIHTLAEDPAWARTLTPGHSTTGYEEGGSPSLSLRERLMDDGVQPASPAQGNYAQTTSSLHLKAGRLRYLAVGGRLSDSPNKIGGETSQSPWA
jgi:hypothetical protein